MLMCLWREYWLGLTACVRFQAGLVVEEAVWQQGLPTAPGVVYTHIMQLCTLQSNLAIRIKHLSKESTVCAAINQKGKNNETVQKEDAQ